MATPASWPPSRSPTCLTVARRLPAATPRRTIGAPIRAASRAHWRQLAAGTDRLVNRRTSGVFPRPERPSAVRAAWRSAGSGAAVSPDDPGTVCPADCRAASPARFQRAVDDRTGPVSEIAVAGLAQHLGGEIAGGHFRRQRRFIKRLFLGQCRAAAPRETEHGSQDKGGSGARIRGHFRYLTRGSSCACATAGSRSSRPRPGSRGAIPRAPRSAPSGCSRSQARWPGPAGSSASGIATCA